MIVLGVDPGFDRIGIAYVAFEARQREVLWNGLITTDKEAPFVDRLHTIQQDFGEILALPKGEGFADPGLVVLEGLHPFGRDANPGMLINLLQVAHARGVMLAMLVGYNVFSPHANQMKSHMTGDARATKPAIRRAVEAMFPEMKGIKRVDDVNDAIGLAATGYDTGYMR